MSKVILKKLFKSYEIYQGDLLRMETYLENKVPFERHDFSIFHQPSDGFVIGHEMYNAPLIACLRIVNEKGKLTMDDYLSECI